MTATMEYEEFNGLPDIPALNELKARRQWVAWRYLERDGNLTKPPVNPHNGYPASHSDPATWGTYEEATKCARERGFPGVGYVLTDDDDITGADLDDCIDEADTIEDWARRIAEHAETYTEISPSGRGLRLIWRGKVEQTVKCDPMHVEVYKNKRYLTITGKHLPGTPTEIKAAPLTEAALRARVDAYKAERSAVAPPPPRKTGVISAALAQMSGRNGGGEGGKEGSNFFRSTNSAALERLDSWVPNLLPMAVRQPGTGAWRVTSRQLGRQLQEDLSIAPNGIVDFGVADMGDPREGRRTPIDLVLEFGPLRTPVDAAQWLCECLGLTPVSLGWRDENRPSSLVIDPAGANLQEKLAGSTAPAAAKKALKFETIEDLRKLPAIQFLVKGWVPQSAIGIFYGKWAAGKSFVGFDLALHLAYAMRDWHGAELPEEAVDVLVIAREGHQGFVARVDAFKKKHNITDDTKRLRFMRGSVSFMRDEDFAALCEKIRATGIKFGLVLVDTVARVLPGVDMNEQQTITLFMERLAVIGEITGAASIGVHHQNKSGGMMGSVFFEANADFVFEITRSGDEDAPLTRGEILCTKMKDGEDRWKRTVNYEKVELSILPDGPSSLVVAAIDKPGKAGGDGLPDRAMCNRILTLIDNHWMDAKPLSNAKNTKGTGRYAAEIIAKQFESVKVTKAEYLIKEWLNARPAILEVQERDAKKKLKGLRVVGSINGGGVPF
jgi:hypothetical protein